MRRWQRILLRLVHRIWFRAALFSLGAVILALVAAGVAPFVPHDVSASIGAQAVDHILAILASSMLAVTTFSLTAMVSAVSAATTTGTPRATGLLVEDTHAQNALSTFLGAFLFAIVGICALSTGFYGETGRALLFAGTLVVIAVIVVTLLRWIQHLSSFGRMDDVIARVEAVATAALRGLAAQPHLGGAMPCPPPADAVSVVAPAIGYITHVDVPALERLASHAGGAIVVAAIPGSFVTTAEPVAWAPPGCDLADVADCFTVEDARGFTDDPRFGLIVLAEIASRALSPAVNDPGTAIAVIAAGVRALAALRNDRPCPARAPHVHVPGVAYDDLLDGFLRPIARDGAGTVEVGIRLQKAIGQLAALLPEAATLLAARADDALARAAATLDHPADLAALRESRRSGWPEPTRAAT